MSALRDHELVTELSEHPDLLAIADAVAETQRARPRVQKRVLVLAAALAVAVVVALTAPWGDRGPGIVENALAAIGNGPVLHAIVEYSGDDAVVDLDTGRSTPRVHRIEYWFDPERKLLHTRLSTDGVKITEVVEGPEMAHSDLGSWPTNGFSPQLDPALTGFATGYREALENGSAREVGKTNIGVRPVTLLAFQRGSREVLTVAVDEETGRPLRFWSTYAGGRRSPEFGVVELNALGRSPSLFRRPDPAPPRPTAGSQGEGRTVPIDEAAARFGATPVWLGRSFRKRPLEAIELAPVTAELTDGSRVEGIVLRFTYGRIRVSIGKDLAGAYALGMEDGGDPPPPAGAIAIARDIGGSRGWAGEMRAYGLYVSISAPTSTELIDAARALRPLP
jgi:hypothetical protein